MDMFGMLAPGEDESDAELADCPPWPQAQGFKDERDLCGIYLTGHPLGAYGKVLGSLSTFSPASPPEIPMMLEVNAERPLRQPVRLAGMLKACTVRMGKPKPKREKGKDVKDAFFLFDEQRVVGKGAWVKAFLKIAKHNHWILLSATPGDTWSDYVPVFLANGFFRSRKDFSDQHVVYARWCTKYPKIDRYLNTRRLTRLRDSILVDMDFQRKTVAHHEDVFVEYNFIIYKDIFRNRWDPYKNEPIRTASELCYLLRKVTNSDDSRQTALLEIVEKHPRCIIFYNFDYELDILKSLYYGENVEIAEWNGHKHQEIPEGEKWVYLVQYTAGCEGWNCIKTDTIIFFSQNYSYKVLKQAEGRIDRLNTPYTDLYYYHLRSRSSIDIGITRALREKKNFNEGRFAQRPSVAKKTA